MNLSAGINWLAAVVAASTAVILRAIWYSRFLFGRARSRALADGGSSPPSSPGAAQSLIGAFVAYLVMATVFSILVDTTGAMTMIEGLHLGFLCWLGFAAPVSLSINLFTGESPSGFYIDAGLQLCFMLAMAMILTVWQ